MILHLAQKLATCLLTKFVLLSEMIVWGEFEATHFVISEELDNLLPGDFGE